MTLQVVENNGLTILENFPRPNAANVGPNDIAYVGTAPDKDASIQYNTVLELTDDILEKLDPNDTGTSTLVTFAREARKHTPGRLFGIVVEDNADNAILKANIIGSSIGREHTGIGLLQHADIQPTLIGSDLSGDVDVAQALSIAAQKQMAIAVVAGRSTNLADAISYRESLATGNAADHILIIDGMAEVYDGTNSILVPAPVVALGSLASRPLNRSPHGAPLLISDIDNNIPFNFIDPNTEGNQLNVNRVNFMKQIGNQGYQVIGHHVASGKFYSHVGLSIIVKRLVINFFSTRIGPDMTQEFVTNLVNEFNQQLYNLQKRGLLAQGIISLNQDLNTASENGAGILYLVVDIARYSPATHYVVEINYQNRQVTIN